MNNFEADLTIIIPTFNRSKWLNCTLKTIANYNLKIVVVDGSTNNQEVVEYRKLIKQINHNNSGHLIQHLVNEGSFFERINMAANIIDTEFCKICADDDLFSIEFINDAICKLKANKKIASVEGGIASYDVRKRKFISFSHQYNDDVSSADLLVRGTALNSRTGIFGVMSVALLRVCSSLSMDMEKIIVKDVSKDNLMWAAYRLMELIYRIVTICFGIIEKSNHLMLLRLYHDDNLGGKLAQNNKHVDYFLSKNNILYLENLSSRIALELDIPLKSVRTLIFYDYFSDLSDRLPIIKNEIRLSFKILGTNTSKKFIGFDYSSNIIKLLRLIVKSMRQGLSWKLDDKMNLVKQEAANLIKELLIHSDVSDLQDLQSYTLSKPA